MTNKITMTDPVVFHRVVKNLLQFTEEGLKIDKNPPQDAAEFYKMLLELESAVSHIKSSAEFTRFLFEYSDDIDILLKFTAGMKKASKHHKK